MKDSPVSSLPAACFNRCGSLTVIPLRYDNGAMAEQVAHLRLRNVSNSPLRIGEGFKYLVEVAAKMDEEWKPIVFGQWMSDRITKIKIE